VLFDVGMCLPGSFVFQVENMAHSARFAAGCCAALSPASMCCACDVDNSTFAQGVVCSIPCMCLCPCSTGLFALKLHVVWSTKQAILVCL
jgi:hypothetical protein